MIQSILPYKTIAIIGMEKNCGKTECLNYLVRELAKEKKAIGVTSVGIDGERIDIVTQSPKPEITLEAGSLFVTSEYFYRSKQLSGEILYLDHQESATGRMVTARAMTGGKIILAGPSSMIQLKESIRKLQIYGAEICLIDGAVSRKSLASPFVTDATILATGAALSANIREVIDQTLFTYRLMSLPEIEEPYATRIRSCKEGIFILESQRKIRHLAIRSLLQLDRLPKESIEKGSIWYTSGAITDKELLLLTNDDCCGAIVVSDFTRLFVSSIRLRQFLASEKQIYVLHRVNLIAITVNPYSPFGYHLKSNELIDSLRPYVNVPVIDVKKL